MLLGIFNGRSALPSYTLKRINLMFKVLHMRRIASSNRRLVPIRYEMGELGLNWRVV